MILSKAILYYLIINGSIYKTIVLLNRNITLKTQLRFIMYSIKKSFKFHLQKVTILAITSSR